MLISASALSAVSDCILDGFTYISGIDLCLGDQNRFLIKECAEILSDLFDELFVSIDQRYHEVVLLGLIAAFVKVSALLQCE